MTMMIREPECVVLKRRGAEYVKKLIEGMSLEEQLEFWRKRTESMLERQKKSNQNNLLPIADLYERTI
ncbi:transposase [Candidatus Magnetomoraceae bacterium gMMP-15]